MAIASVVPRRHYRETFDAGAGGWWGFISNSQGPKPLEIRDGAAISRSPWWVDYNHAPPGAGYLNMVYCLNTNGPQTEHYRETAGENRFIHGRYPLDFTNAQLTVRLKGEMLQRDSQLVLLVQGTIDGITCCWLLTHQPFLVGADWSEQTVTLAPDESQWVCLGARHDRADMYGRHPLSRILSRVSNNIMLVNYPLNIQPMGPIDGDPHLLRAGKDYPLWQHCLPEGYVMMDTVDIEFEDRP